MEHVAAIGLANVKTKQNDDGFVSRSTLILKSFFYMLAQRELRCPRVALTYGEFSIKNQLNSRFNLMVGSDGAGSKERLATDGR